MHDRWMIPSSRDCATISSDVSRTNRLRCRILSFLPAFRKTTILECEHSLSHNKCISMIGAYLTRDFQTVVEELGVDATVHIHGHGRRVHDILPAAMGALYMEEQNAGIVFLHP